MEDKKIDKALLWLQIFVVNVLVLLLYAYFSLPVHAEETSDMPLTMVVTTDIDDSYNNRYGTITYTLQNNVDLNAYDVCAWYRDGKATGTDLDIRTISFIWKRKSDNVISFSSSAVKVVSVDSTGTAVPKYAVGDTLQEITKDASRYDDGTNKGFYPYYTFVSGNYPIAESYEAAENYLLTGDTSGLVSSGSIDNPDFQDTAYAFTGFTANNKMTATWTGTTERSYLKDEEVEEYVRVSYGFADKNAPDSIKQVDNDTTEYATADKSLTVDVSALVPDDDSWFLRYVQVIPCYRQAGLGVWGNFYHGIPNVIYFNKDGSIEKIIQKTKPTDLNKGNMVYDSSIGYLQNVIYTEQKTHDGTGRQATFKWSTQKSLPSDAQVEIVAQNFYVQWFNKKTEENFVFKEYGEDCFYSAGSYSFNSQTPVWTWLKEKEIDPFSFKTQSYGSTEYYLRIVTYSDSDSLYHYGGWVKVNIKEKTATRVPSTDVETGGFDESSGLWNQDTESDDSYHYSTDDEGKLTGNIDVNSWEDLNMNSFTWMYRNMQSMVSSLGEFPTMVNSVFGYLPVQYITAIGVLLVAIVLLRFLGR